MGHVPGSSPWGKYDVDGWKVADVVDPPMADEQGNNVEEGGGGIGTTTGCCRRVHLAIAD